MAVTIKTTDKSTGEMKTYRVKDFDELTLLDWRDLTAIKLPEPDEDKAFDHTLELLARHTGITKDELSRLNPANADLLINAIGDTLAQAMEAKAGTEVTNPPPTIDHEGTTYTVPQDLDADTVAGQWWDFKAAHRLEHEADIMIRSLAVLLVPEGEEYDGNPDSRMEIMGRMPMQSAFHLSAFFFDSSQRYREHTSLSFLALLTSTWRRTGQGHLLSQTVTKK